MEYCEPQMSEENIYECEIRILKKNLATGENYDGWKVVPVREAIESKLGKEDVRCKGCHGKIKLLNQYGTVGTHRTPSITQSKIPATAPWDFTSVRRKMVVWHARL
jgi:hypothetical protein